MMTDDDIFERTITLTRKEGLSRQTSNVGWMPRITKQEVTTSTLISQKQDNNTEERKNPAGIVEGVIFDRSIG